MIGWNKYQVECQEKCWETVEKIESKDASAGDYLSDIQDYRFTVDSNKQYIGAHILIASGDINIWIHTIEKRVYAKHLKGCLMDQAYFDDNLGVCNYMKQLYKSI